MRSLPLALVYFCSLLTCSSDTQREPAPHDSRVDSSAPSSSITESSAASEEPLTDERTFPSARRTEYALARHLERAEQRRGDSELFDFGVPGDAKYTQGGWLGRRTESQRIDERSALRVRAHDLRLSLPADRTDLARLTLALRSFAPATLIAALNGRDIGTAALQGQGFESIVMVLPAGQLRHGDNTLDLRLTAVANVSEPGFAIDFIALSQADANDSKLAPAPPEELRPDPVRDLLRVPDGLTLSYTFEVPEAASFFTRVSASQSGDLTLRLVRDGEPEHVLGVFDVAATPGPLRLDLAPFAHQLVRLDIQAEHAAIWLEQPSIQAQPSWTRELDHRPIRNVVIFLIDTLRADKLTAYNPQTRVRTPGLTRFSESAAVLTAARSQENWTKPSVATLLSSLQPWQHNTSSHEAVLPSSVQLLPELLHERGFTTGAFVANGYVSEKFGFQQGWDSYRNYIREGLRGGAPMVANDVLAWLSSVPRDRPFFLYVHTIDPHVPYQPPREFLSLYDPEPYSGPVSFARSCELLDQIKVGALPLEPRDRERLVALYDGAISYHDVYFDAIVRGLAERGLEEDTLVVVTADHGEEFWDHGSVGHGHSLYDELLHVPLLFRVPSISQHGERVTADVGLIDVAPTILDALGEPPPPYMQGRTFLPELLGDAADAPRVSVAGFMTGQRALATGRYKLVQRWHERTFLYDTSKDPAETRDLSAERPLALRYLRGLLGLALSDSRAPHAAQKTDIDSATEQQLRALGYVGAAGH